MNKVGSGVEKIVINAVCENGAFSTVKGLSVNVAGGPQLAIETAGRSEAALILCEIYKRNGQWKIRNVSQGFNGGLQVLAEHFGIEVMSPAPVAEPTPKPPPKPAPQPTPDSTSTRVNINKVSLTKNERTVSIKKDDGRFGRILVNLNWNQSKSGGFMGFGKTGIDLDLGAMIEFQNGTKGIVQALGNNFGDYVGEPFIKLRADDRSGSSTDGEWLEINGDEWRNFKRILIFAFIYEGVASWQETDGVIRVMVPNQPEVEVRMNELGTTSKDLMCAVATLENQGGQIRVVREVSFFTNHEPMDQAYGFGFRWRAATK